MGKTFKTGIIFLLCWLPYSLSAYDFVVDGIYYHITDKSKRTVEVTHWEEETNTNGTPRRVVHHDNCCQVHDHEHGSCKHLRLIQMDKDAEERERTAYIGTIRIPSEVRYKKRKYTVTGIGEGSFYNRRQLEEVILPPTLTYINRSAFENCLALREVHFPASLTQIGMAAFRCCMALTALALPDSIHSIDMYAFAFCEKLTKLNIPLKLDTFPGNMVFHCVQLHQIVLPHTVPPVVENGKGLKMDFGNMVFYVPEEALLTYRNDNFWCKQKVQVLE